ncbi:hypothetical protein [Salana multivorans]
MPPPSSFTPMPPQPWSGPVAGQQTCGVDEGSHVVSSALAGAAELTARAREHVLAAEPRLWDGSAARTFSARREEDLARLDHLAETIEAARAALLAHVVARRDLAASLTGSGLPWGQEASAMSLAGTPRGGRF